MEVQERSPPGSLLTFRDRMNFCDPLEQVQQFFRVFEVVTPFRGRRFLHAFVRAIP